MKYENFKGLIHATARAYCRNTSDLDEFLSIGRTTFMNLLKERDPVADSFLPDNYFGARLRTSLQRDFLKHMKKNQLTLDHETAINSLPCPRVEWHPRKALESKEWVASLSNEAREVLQLLMNCPMEAFGILAVKSPRRAKGQIRDGLRRQGWSWKRIWKVMSELNEAVR